MRVAIIDLGTNTFKVLIVQIQETGAYHLISKHKIPVKLADGGINDDYLSIEAFRRGINALRTFQDNIIKYYQVSQTFAFATSGIRSAKNGEEFVEYVRNRIGIDIQIISGNREAELIYKGICSAVQLTDKPVLMMDIGGGSTEFIIGNKQQIFWKKSYQLGASRLLGKFRHSNPIQANELEEIKQYFDAELHELSTQVSNYQIDTLIGSSGAFSTFAAMVAHQFGSTKALKKQVSYQINMEEYLLIHKILLNSTLEERTQIESIKLMRVHLIVIASILTDFVIKKLNISQLVYSDYALKEGVISSIIKKLKENENIVFAEK